MKIITSKGLWVSSSFTERFGSEDITPAKTVPAFATLHRDMYDKEIKSELNVEECTLADVAAFLKNPPEGCDDSYWNIFYVAGYVVRVYWRLDHREWGVRAWSLDDDYWCAGRRAFGCNRPSESLASSESGASLDSLTLPSDIEARLKEVESKVEEPATPETVVF